MSEGDNGNRRHFDWRMAGVTFLIVAGQGAIQYGVIVTKMSEFERRMEHVEAKIDDKMMTRDEFEKRHQDLERRVEDLRERVQQLELAGIRKGH
jgi:predicted nuclease with TOPRIM domain